MRDVPRSRAKEVGVFGVGGEFIFEQSAHEIKCARVRIRSVHCTGSGEVGVRTYAAGRMNEGRINAPTILAFRFPSLAESSRATEAPWA